MWGLRGEARWAVDEARAVGYGVGVGTAVADGATDASLAGGSHGALARSSVAPDLIAATAAGLPPLVLTAVRATASCRRNKKRLYYYYP